MYKKYAKIRIRPIVYETNTNGEYELDTNGDKIVLILPENVTASDEYDTLIEVEEYFYE
jgi:hypothetical protein